jgi:hypothetical protein
MAVVAIAFFSVLWLPVIPLFGAQLFIYIQKPPAYVAPPILALFLSGAFIPSVTADAAFAGLIIGVCFGVSRFIVELAGVANGNPGLGGVFVSLNFLYFSVVNFVLSLSTMLLLSNTREEQACKMQRMERVCGQEGRQSGGSSTFEAAAHSAEGSSRAHNKLVWRRGLFNELMLRSHQEASGGGGGGEGVGGASVAGADFLNGAGAISVDEQDAVFRTAAPLAEHTTYRHTPALTAAPRAASARAAGAVQWRWISHSLRASAAAVMLALLLAVVQYD